VIWRVLSSTPPTPVTPSSIVVILLVASLPLYILGMSHFSRRRRHQQPIE
jgi:hypothetical protein